MTVGPLMGPLATGNFNGSTITLRFNHLCHLSFFRESAPFTAFGGASPVGGRKNADGLWQIDEKGFDFKHQSSHPPLRGCPGQGRMKFLRPKAGCEGRVGGHKKIGGLSNFDARHHPDSRVPTPGQCEVSKTAEISKFQRIQSLAAGTSMGPQLRHACIICVICHSFESQPPSPPSAELPP